MNFIYDFILYNTLGFTLGTTTFLTLEYINDPKNFSKNIKRHSHSILGWSIDRFLEYKVTYDEQIKPHIDDFLSNSKKQEKNISDEPEVIITENNEYMSIIIDDKLYYFNMNLNRNSDTNDVNSVSDNESMSDNKPNIKKHNDDTLNLTPSNPFTSMTVLVSFANKEIEYDITRNIRPFCICGNIIDNELIEVILSKHNFDYDYITNINILTNEYDLKKYNLQEPVEFIVKVLENDKFINYNYN